LALARAKLDAVRKKQLSTWDWISWDEQDFRSPQEAELSLMRELGIASMFSDGKVICCQGLPTFHHKIAKSLEEIPEGILLVVMAPVDKTTSLFLKSSKDEQKFKIDMVDDISKPKAREAFVADRAEKMGVRMDAEACRVLSEMCGNSHDMISSELKKLKAYSEDGVINASDVQAACVGDGDAALFELSTLILCKEAGAAHEWMKRLLITTDGHAVVGYLCNWARVMCILSSVKLDSNRARNVASGLYKLEKVDERRARRVPMYPNTGRFYHAAREMQEASLPVYWPWLVMAECHRLELATRFMTAKEDFAKETHRFIERILAEEEPSSLRPLPIPAVVKEPKDRRKTKKYEVIDEVKAND